VKGTLGRVGWDREFGLDKKRGGEGVVHKRRCCVEVKLSCTYGFEGRHPPVCLEHRVG
jgi:hypothetical protein